MISDLSSLCIHPDSSIHQAMACIDQNAAKIALVVDEKHRLLDTITDGDVRRAILAGLDLDAQVSVLKDYKADSPYPHPVTASADTDPAALRDLMRKHQIRSVPLLDEAQRVVGVVTRRELFPNDPLTLQAVVMAGGHGTRLRPLTEELPKPMLPVGDRPLLERIIAQLRQVGIQRVNITTHYMSEKITQYFGDGQEFGVELNYVTEDRPLGTAGALGLMESPNEPFLVINGDILTRVDFRAMLDFHRDHSADLTVAVRQYDLQVPYGVIESEGPLVRQLREKPSMKFLVNAGIYLLEPSIHHYIPNDQQFDMTDLIQRLLDEGQIVVSFPVVEYWLDVGQPADYEQAQDDIEHWSSQS